MSETPSGHGHGPDMAETHRRLGAGLFNRSWDLLDQPSRTSDEDDELLAVALASRWHWQHVGDASNLAIGDNQIARAFAALGHGELALRFARKSAAVVEREGWTDFRLASTYEILARAHATLGDDDQRDVFIAKAKEAIAVLGDPEDREVILGQLRTVPGFADG